MSTEVKRKRKAKGRLMNQAAVEEEFGIPRRDVIRWSATRAGGFPAPVQVFNRTYLFNRADLEEWAAGPRRAPACSSPSTSDFPPAQDGRTS